MPATPTGAHDPGGPQLGRARRARQPRRGVPVEGSAGPLRRWPLCHGRLEHNGKERKKGGVDIELWLSFASWGE